MKIIAEQILETIHRILSELSECAQANESNNHELATSIDISLIADGLVKLPTPIFHAGPKVIVNLTTPLNRILIQPNSAKKFKLTEFVALQWPKDGLFQASKSDGASLILSLTPTSFLKCVADRILARDTDFAFSHTTPNLQLHTKSALVSYNVPFGPIFTPHHFRACLIAQSIAQSLELQGFTVTTRPRIQFWTQDVGNMLAAHSHCRSVAEPIDALMSMYGLLSEHEQSPSENLQELKRVLSGEIESVRRMAALMALWKDGMRTEMDRLGLARLSLDGVENAFSKANETLSTHTAIKKLREKMDHVGSIQLAKDIGSKKLFLDTFATIPSQLLWDFMNLFQDSAQFSKVIHVIPATEQYVRTTVMQELCAVVEAPCPFLENGNTSNVIVANVSGLDVELPLGKYAAPSRWIDSALDYLKHVTGKAFEAMDNGSEAEYEDSDEEEEESAETERIASSAIAIQILQSKRTKEMHFDWSRIQDSKRDLGLYLQYSYARICGIQRKSGQAGRRVIESGLDLELLHLVSTSTYAINIAVALANLPGGIRNSFQSLDATAFVAHVVNLARAASGGHNSLFVKDRMDVDMSTARLIVWKVTGLVLRNLYRKLLLHIFRMKGQRRFLLVSIGCMMVLFALQWLGASMRDTSLPRPPKLRTFVKPRATGKGLGLTPFQSTQRDSRNQTRMDHMLSHAWSGYVKHAWGHDDLKPISKTHFDWYAKQNLLNTPVDALDSLFIMGLKDEYSAAKELILSNLDFATISEPINLFETVIRILGGLLSAYELDGDPRLLSKCTQLADRVLFAFDTQTGFPLNTVNMAAQVTFDNLHGQVGLAEIGSLQLEFQYLSDVTGNPVYAEKALYIYDQLNALDLLVPGLFPLFMNRDSLHVLGDGNVRVSIGAMGDSFYEYLLKMWLSTGEGKYYDMYWKSAEALRTHMASVSSQGFTSIPPTSIYIDDSGSPVAVPENLFDHLSCFAGGMFSLGAAASHQTQNSRRSKSWKYQFELGRDLTEYCWSLYESTSTGLGPETAVSGTLMTVDGKYQLRPEMVESLFYMWRLTHDDKYRERAWKVVESLERHCRTSDGYHGLLDVNDAAAGRLDMQESFFLAETLKYLYLIFADDDVIPLEKYVFNTEAHPISVRGHGRRSDPKKFSPLPRKYEGRKVGEIKTDIKESTRRKGWGGAEEMKWSDAVAGDSEAGDSEHENESEVDVMEEMDGDEDEYGREREDAEEEDVEDDDQEAEWTRKLLRLDPASAPTGVAGEDADAAEDDDDDDEDEEEDGTVPDRPASAASTARRALTSSELATILASDNVEVLIAGFIRFNYALKRLVRHAVDHEVSDESSLVRNYLKTSPETPELIRIWQFQQKHNVPRLDVLVLDAIGYVLLASRIISARSTGTHLARTMIRNHMKPLYKALSSKKHALMQAACRVLSALVIQSSSCTRELFESFNFTMKALPTLFKIKKTATDGGRMEDIRGLYIRFLLGFLMYGDANVKKGIMETKDAVSGIFKGCWEDHFSTLEFVLSVLKKKVVDDTGLSRSVKQQFFNNYVVELITKLYGRSDPTVPGNTPASYSANSIDSMVESSDDSNETAPRTVADLAHDFLIHLCTRPGFGICVQEPGWLQIKKLVVGDAGGAAMGRLRKQKNSHLIKWAAFLRPTEIDLEMTALLELLKNCPELVQPYLAQLTLSFEPRLSSKWIKNMALLANIISLPVPDLFSSAKIYIANPSTILAPPTVSTLAENILPNALNRLAMGRGLQHPSVTVRHISAFVLGAALGKLSRVLAELDRVALHFTESKKETDGAVEVSSTAADEWINLKEALVNEIRRRVPEVQLVLGLYMKLAGAEEAGNAGKKSGNLPASKAVVKADEEVEVVPSGEADMEEDATVTPIVIQCASLRLIREYQNHFPEQMAESRFDYGKLVPSDLSSSGVEIQKATLEFLMQVPQFKWWTNPAGSQNSHLQTLMKLYCFSDPIERAEIKELARKVVAHFLTSCYIFQNSLDEVPLWLDTVSEFSTMSSSSSNAPSVISWFDAACCSAIKSPHKAIDRMSRIVEKASSSLSALERQTVSHMYENRSMQSQPSANTSTVTFSEDDGDLNADSLAFRDVFPFSPVFACAMDGMLALLKSLQQKTESAGALVGGERGVQILGIAQSFCVVGLEILCGTQAVGAFMGALLNEGMVTLKEVVGEMRTQDFTASLPYSYMVLLKAAAEGSVLPLSSSKTSGALTESNALVPLPKLLSLLGAEQQNLMASLVNVAESDEKAKAQLSIMCFILSSLNDPLTEKWVLSYSKFLSPRALVKGMLSAINASAKVESEVINQIVLQGNGSVQLANTVLQWLQRNVSKTSRIQVESVFEILTQILSQAHTIGGSEWSRLRNFVFRHPLLLTAFASTDGAMFSSILGLLEAFLLKDFSKSTETVYEDYINQVQVSLLAELSPGSNYVISPSTLSAFTLVRDFMPQTHLNRILDAVLTIPVMNDPNQTERQNRLLSLVLTSTNVLHVQEQRVISMQAFLRLLKLMHDCPSNELDKIFESAVLGSSHQRLGVSTEVVLSGRTMPIFAHVPSLLDMDTILLLVNQPTSSRLRVLKKLVEWSGFVRDFVLDRVGSLKSNVAQSVFESALSSLTVVSAFSCDWVENTSDLRKEQVSKLKTCADVALTRMADRVLKGSVSAGEIQSDLRGQSDEVIRIVSLNLMGAKQTGFFNKLVADYLSTLEYPNVGGSVFWLNHYFDALVASEMAESKTVDLKASIFTVFIKSLKLYFHSRKRVELPIKPSDPQYVFEKSAVELLVKVQAFLVSTNTSLDVVSNGFTSTQSVEILGDFIKVGLKYRILEIVVVELLGDLVQMLYMKMESRPIPLDQLLSMISGHSQFKNIIKPIPVTTNNASKGGFVFHPCKAPVVRLLRAVINHADNETVASIRSTVLPSLSTSYSGTRHESDREILSIWQLYENRYGLSVASNAIHWGQLAAGEDADPLAAVAASSGATGNVSPASAAESLSLIDPILMSRTIHAFPIRASLLCSSEASGKGQDKITDSMDIDGEDNGKDDTNTSMDKASGEEMSGDKDEIDIEEEANDKYDEKSQIEDASDDLELYDTSFFLPLIAVAVKVGGDKLDVKKLVETNALGLAVMALASQDDNIRKAGYFILDVAYTGFYKVEDLKEKLQLTLLLTMLKNGITDRSESHYPKLPTIIALFFSNALAILSKPEHFMYPLVNSFLLSRPTVDFEDVPMFYSLFNSSTANCRRERVWLYRLLCGGLKDPLDYRLYKRRHVIDLMMSFFHFPLADVSVRKLTFEFLFNSVKISAVVTDMVNERGLLTFVTTLCSNLNFNPNNELSLALPRLMRHIAGKWYGSAEYQRSNKSPIAQSKSNAWTCAFYTCCVSLLKTVQGSFLEYAEASRLSEASDEAALTAYTWWITLLQESVAALRTIVDMSNAVANSFVVMKVGEISQLLDFISNIKKTCTSLDPTKRLDTSLSASVLTVDSLYSVPSTGSLWHLLRRLETDLLAVVVQGPSLAAPSSKIGLHGLSQSHAQSSARVLQWACDLNDRGRIESQKERKAFFAWILSNIAGSSEWNGEEPVINHVLQALFAALVCSDSETKLLGIRSFYRLSVATTTDGKKSKGKRSDGLKAVITEFWQRLRGDLEVDGVVVPVAVVDFLGDVVSVVWGGVVDESTSQRKAWASYAKRVVDSNVDDPWESKLLTLHKELGQQGNESGAKDTKRQRND
ncbi:hypothetical protein CcCBS67573_g00932 [Chytriomyces confervae]|uniref:alpha-1,2-Mannosidase n=1 Tax=Chytriomyces confervae TaxID=246404 RepID=A0A507FQN2_9FUNG|nr:hypothetical protein CcCBS67573_g00932 [Chytriomyces confervae]